MTIIDDLRRKKEEIYLDLHKAIENGISPMIEMYASTCVCSVISSYFQGISTIGVWPPSEVPRKSSISDIQTKILRLTVSFSSCLAVRSRCTCDEKGSTIKRQLEGAVNDITNNVNGFCLDCVKSEGGRGKQCRISHTTGVRKIHLSAGEGSLLTRGRI